MEFIEDEDEEIKTVVVKGFPFKQTDPYGFFFHVPDKKGTPAELQGAFTTVFEIEKAIGRYEGSKIEKAKAGI